jgi:hypothetical protein
MTDMNEIIIFTASSLALAAVTIAFIRAHAVNQHLGRLAIGIVQHEARVQELEQTLDRFMDQQLARHCQGEAVTEPCPAPTDWVDEGSSGVRAVSSVPPEADAVGQDFMEPAHRDCLRPPVRLYGGSDEP